MRVDYELQGPTQSITVEVEKEVAERIQAMEKHSGLKISQLANTALKRFISHHKDFLPPGFEINDLRTGRSRT